MPQTFPAAWNDHGSTGQKGEHLELSVEDEGPGVDEADRERLFERFYSHGNDQGAGLGLTIVQAIAVRLGGSIRLENRDSGGLRATLEISNT